MNKLSPENLLKVNYLLRMYLFTEDISRSYSSNPVPEKKVGRSILSIYPDSAHGIPKFTQIP